MTESTWEGPWTKDTFASVRDALNRHSVLVFPDQDVEPPAQVEFSGRFGRLKHHVLKENLLPGLPEIYVLTNMTSQNEVTPRPYAGAYWHTDLSYEYEPAFGSVMYAVEVPEVGGDTMFCSMAAAYDALSDRMKALLEGLTATHSFEHAYETFVKHIPGTAPISRERFDARPPVSHPLVHTHPESGRRCLYVNPGFTERINELPPAEGEAVLAFLYEHCTSERFVYRHRWSRRDVVMWPGQPRHDAQGGTGLRRPRPPLHAAHHNRRERATGVDGIARSERRRSASATREHRSWPRSPTGC